MRPCAHREETGLAMCDRGRRATMAVAPLWQTARLRSLPRRVVPWCRRVRLSSYAEFRRRLSPDGGVMAPRGTRSCCLKGGGCRYGSGAGG